MESSLILLFMFSSLVVFMLSGAGLAFVLGAIAFISTILLWGPSALIVAVLNTFETMTSESLMAIPLYVLMASILERAGIAEDDLSVMLRDYRRLADQSERYADYAQLLHDVAPEILDGDLQVYTFAQIAEVARTHLDDAEMSRRHWDRVLEVQPDNRQALDALEALTAEADDHVALLDRACAVDPFARSAAPAKLLDVRAKEGTALEHHLETVVIGRIVAASYHYSTILKKIMV